MGYLVYNRQYTQDIDKNGLKLCKNTTKLFKKFAELSVLVVYKQNKIEYNIAVKDERRKTVKKPIIRLKSDTKFYKCIYYN